MTYLEFETARSLQAYDFFLFGHGIDFAMPYHLPFMEEHLEEVFAWAEY